MLLQVWSKRETLQGKSTSKGDGEPSCTTIDSVPAQFVDLLTSTLAHDAGASLLARVLSCLLVWPAGSSKPAGTVAWKRLQLWRQRWAEYGAALRRGRKLWRGRNQPQRSMPGGKNMLTL